MDSEVRNIIRETGSAASGAVKHACLGATPGATGMNNSPGFRARVNDRPGRRPRSLTGLNGSGRPHWNLRRQKVITEACDNFLHTS
jgi:hypothetical protein